jgi:hypothetical protein
MHPVLPPDHSDTTKRQATDDAPWPGVFGGHVSLHLLPFWGPDVAEVLCWRLMLIVGIGLVLCV